ncbi:MAG TPA: helix-turn-helix transcriptional regulator, partial [Actinopolymorphaceae bacterium]|nr:helix-turn-helix transcriptional regulator [Actinopolymorphaceae bacterium]
AFACHLREHAHSSDPSVASRLATAFLELVSATLTTRLPDRTRTIDGVVPSDDTRGHGGGPYLRQALLNRILASIEERLGEPDLSPATIAASHHISLRYLHKLFENHHHTTVASWIRHRRLERSRTDLLDPTMASLPVNAIAARWGFTTAASFNRRFRSTYGTPPGHYRSSQLRPTRATATSA